MGDHVWEDSRATIISGFPGIGKTMISKHESLHTLDIDSSDFSWIEEGVRDPSFPDNYIKYIIENSWRADYIFVSSHKVVRDALKENNIRYILVYPSIESKDEYLQRYRDRGDSEQFINLISTYWESFIESIEEELFPRRIRLRAGQYLSNIIDYI